MKAAVRLLLVLALVAPAFDSVKAQVQSPAPTCKLFASATTVKANTKVQLQWTSANATSGYLNEVGTIAPNGSAYVVPGKNITYAASFTGPGGSVVCRVAVAVSAGSSGGGIGGSVQVDTNNPVDLSGSSINTNVPVDLSGTANLGGSVSLPTAQSVAPGLSTQSSSGGFMGGLVPAECRGKSTIANCDLCSLAQMGQNLANFGLGLTVPIAVLWFAWAGILFFSSRGNPVQYNRAKKIFMYVVIGLVIAVSAFMLINTVMNMLIRGGDLRNWNWQTLNCTETRKARLYNMSLEQYLNSSLPGLTSYTGPSGGSAYECISGTLQGSVCVDSSGKEVGKPLLVNSTNTGSGSLGCSQYGANGGGYYVAGTQCVDEFGSPVGPALRPGQMTDAQLQELAISCAGDEYATPDEASCAKLQAAQVTTSANAIANVKRWDAQVVAACEYAQSLDDCGRIVQAIMTTESAGNCNAVSSAGAMGCMQLMPTTACGVNPSINGCGTCTNWDYNKGSQCQEVRQALLSDPALNIQTGTQELARLSKIFNGDETLIAAAYNGGQKANNYSTVCGGGTAWQCTQNSGYAETRNYVVKVNNTLTNLR